MEIVKLDQMKKLILPSILILSSLATGWYFVQIASDRKLTDLEGVLLQGICLGLGLVGSYFFGKQSAKAAALEMIKPHARSAFRRLISLYKSLSRVSTIIAQNEELKPNDQKIALAQISAIVSQQVDTADDALEDWRDIVPEEVDELKENLVKHTQEALINE